MDTVKRPFLSVGFTAFVLLIPLAATSSRRMMMKRLGRIWQRLHRLIHVCAGLGSVHDGWLVKRI